MAKQSVWLSASPGFTLPLIHAPSLALPVAALLLALLVLQQDDQQAHLSRTLCGSEKGRNTANPPQMAGKLSVHQIRSLQKLSYGHNHPT